MSSIYLNQADIRSLLAGLGKTRPIDGNWSSAIRIIASSLDIRESELVDRVWRGKSEAHIGVHVTKEGFLALIEAMRTNDTTEMKNTERLALVATALSWKPDALMSHLKLTTASLGRSKTLAKSPFKPVNLESLGIDQFDKWRSISQNVCGMNIVAGPSGSGKSTTQQRTVAVLVQNEEQRRSLFFLEDGFKMPQSRILNSIRGEEAPIVVFHDEPRTDADFELACQVAEFASVFVTVYANSAPEAYKKVIKATRPELAGRINGVLCQFLALRRCDDCDHFRPECVCKHKKSRFVVSECLTSREIEEAIAANDVDGLINEAARLVVFGQMKFDDAVFRFGDRFHDIYQRFSGSTGPRNIVELAGV